MSTIVPGAFGPWLEQHRRAAGITQEELSTALACSLITLQMQGERRFPVPPLQLPIPTGPCDLAALARSPVCSLGCHQFGERGQPPRHREPLAQAASVTAIRYNSPICLYPGTITL